ncbi:F-box/kelch-repeat protein OR23 [Primulina huaijiensis]|uniref:F-box/kelch-repeat protein OR23 n=1 Tax=Primulina huaijiensis TaxID=1492673 RepID=UPI003CC6FE07
MAPLSSSEDIGVQNLAITLIPGLPNDLGALILAFVPYAHHARLKSTCKSWRRFFSSKTLISLRQNYVVAPQLLCIFPQDPSIFSPYLFDPKNLSWCPLPPMPCNPHVYGLSNFISVSVGPHFYVLGGSLFDTRSFPLDRPSPSSSAFRFDFSTYSWELLSPMITPRGSFACAAVPELGKIVVAGGGSRHTMFGAAGSRMSSVEMYDIGKDEWVALDGLPRFRAGCVGFFLGKEFWVMGGYGESRTVSGVFPVDEYYRDAVVMELKNGSKWKELGDMWEEGERRRLGKIVVVEGRGQDGLGIFMLDRSEIFRYNMICNRWTMETAIPKRASDDSSVGFIALDGELHLLTLLNINDSTTESRRSRQHKRSAALLIQIYHPVTRTWRSLVAKPPFPPLDFKTAVMCTIRL